MLRLEVLLFGRKGSLIIGPWLARPWGACFAGAVLVEAGPVKVALFTRRMFWN
jgi:hypothetical protein